MDPRLLGQYERELRHLQGMAGEFSKEFPKIAGRLGLDEFECADPYVERLLEGCAYLAARVQVQINAQFPTFTAHLMEMVYPHYLAPIPSMAVVQFQPDLNESGLSDGFPVSRQCSLLAQKRKGLQTSCIYRTAHDLTLWPLELIEAEYFDREHAKIALGQFPSVKAGLRIRLRATAGLCLKDLDLDRLPVFIRRFDARSAELYQQFFSDVRAVVTADSDHDQVLNELAADSLQKVGFDESTALLPYDSRSFQGYRLLHEYFSMPQRFMFVEFTGLQASVKKCAGTELDVFVLFDRKADSLVNEIEASDLALFCSPIINLFSRRGDRINLTNREHEYHVLPDRSRPLDFEVYNVSKVTGFGGRRGPRLFRPFYSLDDDAGSDSQAYYALRREARLLSSRQRQMGTRSTYVGSEVFLSLVDAADAPYAHDLRELGLELLCTNRDLPLHMPIGIGKTDFEADISLPVTSIKCVTSPTPPRPSLAHREGNVAWRLVNHLSLNYLTLCDNSPSQGAAALRELLSLYAGENDQAIQKQISGVKSISTQPVTRQLPDSGPLAFGRGLEISVEFDETAFEGTGILLLGAVLDEFFAKYASINSMTETVIKSSTRGEIVRWPTRIGRRLNL